MSNVSFKNYAKGSYAQDRQSRITLQHTLSRIHLEAEDAMDSIQTSLYWLPVSYYQLIPYRGPCLRK